MSPDGSLSLTDDVRQVWNYQVELEMINGGIGRRRLAHGQTSRAIDGATIGLARVAQAMLIRWSGAERLRLRIREHSGEIVVRDWPLGNMREIVRIIAEQRKARGLP